MTKKQINKIVNKVTGYNNLGFIDVVNDAGGWQEFANTYFKRDGEIDGHSYTAELNKRLSTVSMLQTLDEIRKRLLKELEGLEQAE